jgi:hypothetical protein
MFPNICRCSETQALSVADELESVVTIELRIQMF